jgi:hypothetical protein
VEKDFRQAFNPQTKAVYLSNSRFQLANIWLILTAFSYCYFGKRSSKWSKVDFVDVCSIRQVLPHKSKCLDVWKSSKAFYLGNLL